MTVIIDTEECIHGLIGCATCEGIDEGSGPNSDRSAGIVNPWTKTANRIAKDMGLTSRQAANLTGRTVNQMSARRINHLGMTGYAGYRPHPHS